MALICALVPGTPVLFRAIFPLHRQSALALYYLHQRYQNNAMPPGYPLLVAMNFLLGLFLYNAFVRAEYPAIGSNFVPSILAVVLVLWIGRRLKILRRTQADGDENY